jgi:hypothetical protein
MLACASTRWHIRGVGSGQCGRRGMGARNYPHQRLIQPKWRHPVSAGIWVQQGIKDRVVQGATLPFRQSASWATLGSNQQAACILGEASCEGPNCGANALHFESFLRLLFSEPRAQHIRRRYPGALTMTCTEDDGSLRGVYAANQSPLVGIEVRFCDVFQIRFQHPPLLFPLPHQPRRTALCLGVSVGCRTCRGCMPRLPLALPAAV